MSDDGATDGGPQPERGAGAELRDWPAAAVGAGANPRHQRCPLRHTTLLPGTGVHRCDEREGKRAPTLLCLCVFSMSPVSFHVKQSQSAAEDGGVLSELQKLREQLGESEEKRKAAETQLSEAKSSVIQFQERGTCCQGEYFLANTLNG